MTTTEEIDQTKGDKMIKAIVITVDGLQKDIEISEDTSLKTLQDAVGGFIQAIDLLGLTMWINEEGKIDDLPFNPFATILWEAAFGKTDVILGDIVLTGLPDDEGNLTDIPQAFVDMVLVPSYHSPEDCPK